MARCSNCRNPVGLEHHTYNALEFPVATEWPVITTDAVDCCSLGCLVDVLQRRLVDRRQTG